MLLSAYFLCGLLYALLTYGLVDPNLVLINHPVYWQFQTWMWQTFFHNSLLLTQGYLLITTLWFVIFLSLVVIFRRKELVNLTFQPKMIGFYVLLILPLLFAYNALSHDVFNYIFNAKMVLVYGADPHQVVALNFAADDWTRFMHNTHTPAPYGYGWTALSLLPYLLGGGKFITTWFAFRFFSLLSLLVALWVVLLAAKAWTGQSLKVWQPALFFLNPLVVIEVIGNSHNDLWMMVPAMAGLVVLTNIKTINRQLFRPMMLGVGLLLLSVSIKYATLLLLPLVTLILLEKLVLINIVKRTQIGHLSIIPHKYQTIMVDWLDHKLLTKLPLIASVLMFLPLLTTRSQQFHPWYLIWPLIWLPLIKFERWSQLMLVFSLSSLWRYAPWILAGGFEGNVLWHQQLTTWLPAGLYLLYVFFKRKKERKTISSSLPRLNVLES